MRGALRDPGVRAALVLVAAAVGGAAGLVLAWRGAAATLDVWLQLPFVLSGAFGGVAVAGSALCILTVHLGRRVAAEEQAAFDEVIAGLSALSGRAEGRG